MKKRMRGVLALGLLLGSAAPYGAAQTVSPRGGDVDTKPMAATARPNFEVATIKPSNSEYPIHGAIGHRTALSGTVRFMLAFIYDVHDKQIFGGPDWMSAKQFDFDGISDTPGTPNLQQIKIMFQKLFADRFQLKIHREQRELSAYILMVANGGPKLTKSPGDPNAMPSLLGRPTVGMKGRNLTMAEFARLLQSGILDRPVLDQTNLQGKYDFVFKWTPDESQFNQAGARIAPPSDTSDAPGLFTGLQEELGLKLISTKTLVDVLVIDQIEKPSEN